MPRRGLLQPLNLSRGGYVERVASSQPLRPEGGSGRQAASASRPRAGEGIVDSIPASAPTESVDSLGFVRGASQARRSLATPQAK